jgi:hypothetical protein
MEGENMSAIESRAIESYFRKFGTDAAQPSSALTEVTKRDDGGYRVVLSNKRGVLAEMTCRRAGGPFRFVEVES